jgi:hypothetical protein
MPLYRNRLAALLAILAIAMQALWPLIAQAKPLLPGERVPVCTVEGITHYIELPAPDSAVEKSSAAHHEHCKMCVFGAERIAVLPVAAPLITLAQDPQQSAGFAVRGLFAFAAPSSRARARASRRLLIRGSADAPSGARMLFGGNLMLLLRNAVFCCASLAAPAAFATCGAAFCTVNTNWDAHGAWAEPGWRFDLRYEHVLQDQPQTGTDKLSVGQIPKHHDEVFTQNRNWLATLDYTFNADWGVSFSLPFVDRRHEHIHNHRGAQLLEAWDFDSAGDARVVGRYRLATFEDREPKLGTAGLYFGLKLPTGRTDVRNSDGDLAERSLQPGSGTTDALLGAYYAQLLPMKDLSWFAQALVQLPMNSRDGFKPGERVSLDAGIDTTRLITSA